MERISHELTLNGAKIREELLEVWGALAKVETFWRFASGPSGSECGIFALVCGAAILRDPSSTAVLSSVVDL